jgi:signal transduction histidine kinase
MNASWIDFRTSGRRFLAQERLASAHDARRVERMLAAARALLAVCLLVAVRLDSLEPPRYAHLSFTLLALYAIYSFGVLAALPARERHPQGFCLVVHALDLLWPAALTLFSSGPNSPLFVLFFFGLMAAAYRWGFRETALSGVATSLILVAEAVLLGLAPGGRLIEGEFELNRFIIRSTYVLVIGVLLGFLAEDEKRMRAQVSAISRIVAKLRADRSFRANLETLADDVMRLFGCSRALLACLETSTDRLFLWRAERSAAAEASLHLSEADALESGIYFFVKEGSAWHAAARRRGEPRYEVAQLSPGTPRAEQAAWLPPAAFLQRHAFRSVLGACFAVGDEWTVSLFLFDPAAEVSSEAALRFLQLLVARVPSAALNVYLLRRLRARVGAMERARVARELHDGILQSLVALEMQVDVLRRNQDGGLGEELAPLQQLLHSEILTVRELMQAMRPLDFKPHEFLDFAADTVEKFQRETGIRTRLVADVEEVWLSPRTGRELGRILQEALVNVRKHASARNVVVRFGREQGRWKLWIDDDGRGFEFAGRLEHQELDRLHRGPAIIKERLRSIQGELAIDSRPGEGARLEITLPRRTYG